VKGEEAERWGGIHNSRRGYYIYGRFSGDLRTGSPTTARRRDNNADATALCESLVSEIRQRQSPPPPRRGGVLVGGGFTG
jgi:hypothetical protein